MTGITVSGASIGLSAAVPAGLTSTSTNAEKVTAYEALTYTEAANCIITKLPNFKEMWDTAEDEPTVCDNEDEILTSFKTNQKVSPTSIEGRFEKSDPIIQLFNTLRASRTDIGTMVITHSNGTDKIWAQIQVTETDEDFTNTTGKVKFMASIIFMKKPVRN